MKKRKLNDNNKYRSNKDTRWCFKCGRIGLHTAFDCTAINDIYGKPTTDEWLYKPDRTNGIPPEQPYRKPYNNNNKRNNDKNTKSFSQYKPSLSSSKFDDQNIHNQLLSLSRLLNNDNRSPLNNNVMTQANELLQQISNSYTKQSSNRNNNRNNRNNNNNNNMDDDEMDDDRPRQ